MNELTQFWRALAAITAVISLWGGLLFWAVRALLDSRLKNLDGQEVRTEHNLLRIEKALLHLRAELPLEYVRKEDAIRQEVTFHAKLDALAVKLDQLREAHGG